MRRHIPARRATTKYFSNSFIFKTEIEKEGLPRDRTPALGAGGPEFKSRRPDHSFLRSTIKRTNYFDKALRSGVRSDCLNLDPRLSSDARDRSRILFT